MKKVVKIAGFSVISIALIKFFGKPISEYIDRELDELSEGLTPRYMD